MGFEVIQYAFTHGELTPQVLARSDITLYEKSAKRLRNALVLPWGGVRRRFGTTYIDDLTATLQTEFRLVPFFADEDTFYLLVFYNDTIDIYDSTDTRVHTIPSTGITAAQMSEFDYAQTTNSMVVVHPDFQPKEIVYTNATTWQINNVPFSNIAGYAFSDKSYESLTFTLASKSGTGVNLDASSTFWTDAYVGGYFLALGPAVSDSIGLAKIISKSSDTQVVVDIIYDFANTTNPGARSKPLEKAWSDTESDGSGNRGWPISVTFYQSRLYFGGSRSLPQVLFGSQVGQFTNFSPGVGDADDALEGTLASQTINDIKYLIADKTLQIFTFSSEWAVPQESIEPITPANFNVRKQSNYGVGNTKPLVLDNATFFVKAGGKGVNAYIYSYDQQGYDSEDISILSAHLINDPVDGSIMRNADSEDVNYLFLVNTDGTLAVYQTLAKQKISAWSLANTMTQTYDGSTVTDIDAYFKNVVNVNNNIYFMVQRTVDGGTKYYLEKLDFSVYTDCTISQDNGTPTSTITGLSKLNGMYVDVRGDGYAYPQHEVDDAKIDLESTDPDITETVTTSEVGFKYVPTLETTPLVMRFDGGATNFTPIRTTRVFVQYYLSQGIEINGITLPNWEFEDTFGTYSLTETGEPQTGFQQVYNGNWDRQPTYTITQDTPAPMTILSLGYEVHT